MKLQRDKLKQYQKNVCAWLRFFLLHTEFSHWHHLDARSNEC